jgi:hypothetical protein
LYNVDRGIRSYRVAQVIAVANLLAIDENHHVLTDSALLVKHIPAGSFALSKVVVEYRPKSGPWNFPRGAFDVALYILGKSDGRHRMKAPSVTKEFAPFPTLNSRSNGAIGNRPEIDIFVNFFETVAYSRSVGGTNTTECIRNDGELAG